MRKGTGRYSRGTFPSECQCSSGFLVQTLELDWANRPIVARTRTLQNGNPLCACRTKHDAGKSMEGGCAVLEHWTYSCAALSSPGLSILELAGPVLTRQP